MWFTFPRHPEELMTWITITQTRGNTASMTTIKIANGITLICIKRVWFIAGKAVASIWGCASSMPAWFRTNWYAVPLVQSTEQSTSQIVPLSLRNLKPGKQVHCSGPVHTPFMHNVHEGSQIERLHCNVHKCTLERSPQVHT
uniref:Uncharacterized protein n=1 Tax=Glossina pallidipes TaxID=7398 RepID=A0A1A9ZH54_GLOPL